MPVGTTGTTVNRLVGSKIAEAWLGWDSLGWFEQLGAVPLLDQAQTQQAA